MITMSIYTFMVSFVWCLMAIGYIANVISDIRSSPPGAWKRDCLTDLGVTLFLIIIGPLALLIFPIEKMARKIEAWKARRAKHKKRGSTAGKQFGF